MEVLAQIYFALFVSSVTLNWNRTANFLFGILLENLTGAIGSRQLSQIHNTSKKLFFPKSFSVPECIAIKRMLLSSESKLNRLDILSKYSTNVSRNVVFWPHQNINSILLSIPLTHLIQQYRLASLRLLFVLTS